MPKIVCKSDFLRNFFRSSSLFLAEKSPIKQENKPPVLSPSSDVASPTKTSPRRELKLAVEKAAAAVANVPTTNKRPFEPKTLVNNYEVTTNSSSNENQPNPSEASAVDSVSKETLKPVTSTSKAVKNAIVSVANVMNNNSTQAQQQNESTNYINSNSNQQNLQTNSNNKFSSHPIYQQLNLQTYPSSSQQYFSNNSNNSGMSSPPCVSPSPHFTQQPSQSNSNSLNNSRSSSPWMISSLLQQTQQMNGNQVGSGNNQISNSNNNNNNNNMIPSQHYFNSNYQSYARLQQQQQQCNSAINKPMNSNSLKAADFKYPFPIPPPFPSSPHEEV